MWQNTGVGAKHDSVRKDELKELSNNCSMYDPCPINYKCRNKATHLYKRCEECPVPHATHNNKARNWAIRRENFGITVSPEVGELFRAAADKQKKGEN